MANRFVAVRRKRMLSASERQQMRDLLGRGLEAWALTLSEAQWLRFERLTELMLEWNERMNLTAVTQPERIAVEHYLDSLAPLAFGLIGEGMGVVDVGTGAGFPGLPLAILCPLSAFTLVEATGKKVAYLRQVVKELGLTNVEIAQGRAEVLAHDRRFREGFDVAVARALGRLDVVLEWTLPFVKVGGCAIAYKGLRGEEELPLGERKAGLLGGRIEAVHRFVLPGTKLQRMLMVIRKISPTPSRFPRRHGQR
jgi:16S rRNA (guanine527-N7)-methyltransferase